VQCHGGAEDIAGGLDLSGGWTWAFNLSYETLLKNSLTGFLNCHNDAVETVNILLPRSHGSGAAPLAKLLVNGHDRKLASMLPYRKDLLLAWMDGNCNYHGTWDYTAFATCNAIVALRDRLAVEMDKAGCVKCHQKEIGNDWINLEKPEWSRLLRAPLAKSGGGLGLAWCRKRPAQPVRLPLVDLDHQPPDIFKPAKAPLPDRRGTEVTLFPSVNHRAYQRMLTLIQQARAEALKSARVDMPGAKVIPGKCRELDQAE